MFQTVSFADGRLRGLVTKPLHVQKYLILIVAISRQVSRSKCRGRRCRCPVSAHRKQSSPILSELVISFCCCLGCLASYSFVDCNVERNRVCDYVDVVTSRALSCAFGHDVVLHVSTNILLNLESRNSKLSRVCFNFARFN